MKPEELLAKNIEHAKLHRDRIIDALSHLENLLPITHENFMNLASEEKAYLDVLAIRFIKLQDIIGSRIFPLTLSVMKENVETNRFLDILNKLEKIRIIESGDFWLEIREIRNYIAHDYPENDQITIEAVNNLYKSSQKLVLFFNKYIEKLKADFIID
ncbi:MAG: hypothetical protein Q8K36_04310 [Alphaproteobacteria bacterium]|nr:hypothetical protein [Alphaproteobacteria bacterium]